MSEATPPEPEPQPGPELNEAGVVVDQAIAHLARREVPDMAVATALLGGAVRVLLGTLDRARVVRVLENAIVDLRAG